MVSPSGRELATRSSTTSDARARPGRRGEEPARASKRGRGIPPGVRGSRAWPPRHGTSGRCPLAEAIIVKSESEPHPSTGQPVGRPVDATPARRPGPVTLEGRYGRVEKLDVRHAANLWKAYAGHDHIWDVPFGLWTFLGCSCFFGLARKPCGIGGPLLLRDCRYVRPRAGHRGADGNPPRDACDRGGSRCLFAGTNAHAAWDRSAISTRPLCVRNARLPTLRMEM